MGPCVWTPLARSLSGAAVVATIQGRDDQRAKWSWPARRLLAGAAWLSAKVPNEVIVVSRQLEREFLADFRRESTWIPNGATLLDVGDRELDTGVLERFEIADRPYVLNVGRVVPEKAMDVAIRAFRQLDTSHRFVIVGGAAGTSDYEENLRALAAGDDRIVFTGPIYGDELVELFRRADLFVTPSRLEGLPLALLESIQAGLPVAVSDIEPHLEVVGGDGPAHRTFRTGDVNDLARALAVSLHERPHVDVALRELRARVAEEYSWERITSMTERVYRQALDEAVEPAVVSQLPSSELSYSSQLPV
jgi:glycosyltransferase involved in cell wall biosynthesis